MSNSNKLLNLRTLHPSLNERSECPGEGSVRSTGGEVIHREQRQPAVEPAHSATPRSTSAASARERGGRDSGRGEVTHREQHEQADERERTLAPPSAGHNEYPEEAKSLARNRYHRVSTQIPTVILADRDGPEMQKTPGANPGVSSVRYTCKPTKLVASPHR